MKLRSLLLTALFISSLSALGRTYHDAAAFGFYGHVKEALEKNYYGQSKSYTPVEYKFGTDGAVLEAASLGRNITVRRNNVGYIMEIEEVTITNTRKIYKYYFDAFDRLSQERYDATDARYVINTDYYYSGKNVIKETYPDKGPNGDPNNLHTCEYRDIKTDSHDNWVSRAVYVDGNYARRQERTITYWDDDKAPAQVEKPKVAVADGQSWLSIGRNIAHTYKYDTEAEYANGREGTAKTVKDKGIKINVNHSGYGVVTFYGKKSGSSGIVPVAGPWSGDYDGSKLTLTKGYKDVAVTPVTLQLLEVKTVKKKTVIKFLLDGKTVITATECKAL